MSLKQRTKLAVLPAPSDRTIPSGIARGVRMHIDFAHQTRTYLGLYEIELNRYLRRLLTPGTSAFDVGGQNGYDALLVAKRTRARVVSFECDPSCVAQMRKNFSLNPEHQGLLTAVEGTVGDAPGDVSLDEFAYGESGFVPDFLKIDIDGGESGALRSAERLLADRHPALVIEVHSLDLELDCGQILVEHGYRPLVVNQRGLWPDERPIAHNRWLVAW